MEPGKSAGEVLVSARELSEQSEKLRTEVEKFLNEVRATRARQVDGLNLAQAKSPSRYFPSPSAKGPCSTGLSEQIGSAARLDA